MDLAYQKIGRHLAMYLFWRFGAAAIGTKNIPMQGPVILIGNHQQVFDGVLLLHGARSRKVITMIKSDGEIRVVLYLLDLLADMFTIKRNTNDRDALRMATSVLENGGALGMFPTGHRSKNVGGFYPGVAMIARHVPSARIAPFGITNAHRLTLGKVVGNLDRGIRMKKPPTIRFGQAFQLPPTHLPTKQQREVDVALIRQKVLALLPPELKGKNELWVVNGD